MCMFSNSNEGKTFRCLRKDKSSCNENLIIVVQERTSIDRSIKETNIYSGNFIKNKMCACLVLVGSLLYVGREYVNLLGKEGIYVG